MRNRMLFALILVASTAFAADSVQFRNNPQHTGVFHDAAFNDRPFIKWRFKTGNKVRSTPAVQGSVLIVGSNDGEVYALDTAKGELKWAFHTGGPVPSSPAISGGVAYFESADLNVYAVDVATGKQAWSFTMGKELPGRTGIPEYILPADFGLWDYFLSSPTIVDGRLYIGGGDGKLYALDARSGKQLWAFATSGRVRVSPAVDSGVVYFGNMNGEFFALDAATGKEKWRFKTQGNEYFPAGDIQSTPAVADGAVVFGSRDFFVYALETATGRLRWKALHKDSWVISPPTISDGLVYLGSSDARFVQALDVKTGEEKWHQSVTGNVFGAIALSGNVAVSGDWDGKLIWWDAKTGKNLGGFLFEEKINASPVIDGDTIYIGCDDDYVTAIGFRPVAK